MAVNDVATPGKKNFGLLVAAGLMGACSLLGCRSGNPINVQRTIAEAIRSCSVESSDDDCASALGVSHVGPSFPRFPVGLEEVEISSTCVGERATIYDVGVARFSSAEDVPVGGVFVFAGSGLTQEYELRSVVQGDEKVRALCAGKAAGWERPRDAP